MLSIISFGQRLGMDYGRRYCECLWMPVASTLVLSGQAFNLSHLKIRDRVPIQDDSPWQRSSFGPYFKTLGSLTKSLGNSLYTKLSILCLVRVPIWTLFRSWSLILSSCAAILQGNVWKHLLPRVEAVMTWYYRYRDIGKSNFHLDPILILVPDS